MDDSSTTPGRREVAGRSKSLAAALLVLARLAAQDLPLIAHLSDPHVGAAAGLPHLRAVLGELTELRPALVVVTGDLTEKGTAEELDRYFDTVEQFTKDTGIQVLSCPGNHDVRWNAEGRGLIERRAGALPRFFRVGDLGVVAMDSTLSFAQHGHLATARLRAVEAIFARETGVRDWVLAFHHPPGDGRFLDDEAELQALLDRWPVSLLLVGHGHAHQAGAFGGVPRAMAIGVMNPRFGYRLWRVEAERILGRAVVRGEKSPPDVEDVRAPRRRGPASRPATASRPGSMPANAVARRFPGTFLSAPLVTGDQVVAATEEGQVLWLAARDLTSRAQAEVRAPVFVSPVYVGAELLVPDGTPSLRRFGKPGQETGQVPLPALVTATAPLPDGGLLLCLSDGTVRTWSPGGQLRELARLGAQVRAAPLVLEDRVLLAPWDRTLRAIALTDGAELGRLQVHASFYYSAATADPLRFKDQALFFGHDQRLLLVERGAALVRELKFERVQPAYSGGTAWREGLCVVGSMSGELAVLDLRAGTVVRRIELGGPVFDSTPLVRGDEAWVGTMEGELVRVDLMAGKVLDRLRVPGYFLADPVWADGAVIGATTAGALVAWR